MLIWCKSGSDVGFMLPPPTGSPSIQQRISNMLCRHELVITLEMPYKNNYQYLCLNCSCRWSHTEWVFKQLEMDLPSLNNTAEDNYTQPDTIYKLLNNNLYNILTKIALIPVFFFSQINFFIFIRIIKILMSKLRAHQMRYTDYKFRSDRTPFIVVVCCESLFYWQVRTNWRCWFHIFTLSEGVSLYFLYFSKLHGKTEILIVEAGVFLQHFLIVNKLKLSPLFDSNLIFLMFSVYTCPSFGPD